MRPSFGSTVLVLGIAACGGELDEVYILDIDNGPDSVSGVRVDGPDIHVFSAPTAGAIVDPAKQLEVVWRCHDKADAATLRAENVDSQVTSNSGSYLLPAGAFTPDKTQARQHMLRLTRTNHVVPEGTTAGSTWSVSIANEIVVVTETQPLPVPK